MEDDKVPTITSEESLAAACQARMDEIDRRMAIIGKELILLRLEKNKLGKVVALLTRHRGLVDCPECGHGYPAPHGIAVHRSKAHGVAGAWNAGKP